MTVQLSALGDLVVATREDLRREILANVEHGHDVDVDLSRAGYIDSSAIGMLLKCSRLAKESGHRVRLHGCTADTRRFFAAIGLLGRLELVDC